MNEHSKSKRVGRAQWAAVALLMLMGIVNYFDRSTISIANHLVGNDLSLTATEMGLIFAAFSWAYAFAQLPMGVLLDRKGARFILGTALALWSLAQAVCGLANSMVQMLLARISLGIGESPQYIGGVKVVSDWFNVRERGAPTGAFLASTTIGSMIAPPVLTALMGSFGWRGMFMIMGAVGLLLALIWFWLYRDRGSARLASDDLAYFDVNENGTGKITPGEWRNLFAQRTTWGVALGFVGVMYMVLLTLAWLPSYLERERHLSVVSTGWVLTIPYLFATAGMFFSGHLADRLVARNWSPIGSRKLPLCLGLVCGAIFSVPTVFTSDLTMAIASLCATMFFINLAGGSAWGLVSVAAPRHLVASLGSIQNFVGFFGGSFAPLLTGWILDRTHSIAYAFVLGAIISCLSALAYLLLVRRPIAACLPGLGQTSKEVPAAIPMSS